MILWMEEILHRLKTVVYPLVYNVNPELTKPQTAVQLRGFPFKYHFLWLLGEYPTVKKNTVY